MLFSNCSNYTGDQIATIKIFLVDDHKLVRRGIKSILTRYADLEIIGEADSGEEALEKIQMLCLLC
ncbi:MAG: response regulator [Bacteroidia bacterium]|nr:response regulator [Bacteroidia bacterium]